MENTFKIRIARTALALAAAVLPLASASAASPAAKPVMIGMDGPEYDACGSQGQVRGLRDEDGALVLSVRAGPSSDAAEIGQLKNAAAIMLCDSTKDGKWTGVVYPAEGQAMSACGVFSPSARRTAYTGPCKSGWVSSTYVTVTAG